MVIGPRAPGLRSSIFFLLFVHWLDSGLHVVFHFLHNRSENKPIHYVNRCMPGISKDLIISDIGRNSVMSFNIGYHTQVLSYGQGVEESIHNCSQAHVRDRREKQKQITPPCITYCHSDSLP